MATLRLQIELLGHFRLSYNGVPVSGISTARQQSLLAYLLLHRTYPQPRQQIAFVFWPDSTDEQALTNLRRELHHLRRALPKADKFLSSSGKQLSWNSDAAFTLDVSEFEQRCGQKEASRQTLEEGLVLYKGDLFPSCYDDWITPERERLHLLCVQAYERLVGMLENEREYAQAIQKTRQLLKLEPLHEAAYRTVMRLYALQGERAAALHAYHTCVSVLESELGAKPSAETQALYQSLLESRSLASANKPTSPTTGVYSLVGRQAEWTMLQQTWQQSASGKASCLIIQGEAGIGKTRLAEELLQWCRERDIATARTRCYAAEGRLAFAPVTEWLRSENLRKGLETLDAVWLSEVARLLPELSSQYNLPRPRPLSENWQRQQFFEALARAFLKEQKPLLLVLDDVQWCDPDTLEWLHYFLRFDSQAKLLVVCTLRLEERQDNLPLQAFMRDLRQLGQLSELELGPLNEAETIELAAQVAEQHPDANISVELFRQTEGHPLFVVEMARSGLTEFAKTNSQLPPKVQAVIATRFTHLSAQARELVELAAVVGRDFNYGVLREASDLDEKNLVQALDELWQRRMIREHGTLSYDFSHDRLREVSYAEVSPIKRQLLHRRVAQALELLHKENLDAVSARLAYHYEEAGQTPKAISFYRQAAQTAQHISANEEAIRHLSKALTRLQQMPASLGRDREELALQSALSHPLMTVRGYSSLEVEVNVTRMGELGRRLGVQEAVINSVMGLQGVYYVRGDIRKSLNLGFEAQHLAEGYAEELLVSDWAVAISLAGVGDLNQAKAGLEKAIAGYDPAHPINTVLGPDLAVFSHSYGAHVLWLLGYPEQALTHYHHAVEMAQSLQNPFNLALVYAYGAIFHQLLRDREGVLTCAREVLALCAKYGFAYYGDWGLILSGWADADTSRIRQGLENLQALGAGTRRPYYLGLLAEVYVQLGQVEEARSVLDAALATASQNEDVWWSAELNRLKGELSGAEACFHNALEIARTQEAKSLELRSAVSLAQVWHKQNRSLEALELLKPVYTWFSEGLATRDLQQAKKLIQSLST